MKGRVLTIAGSDSSGGAGVQADIKTISSLGSYAMSAITAITVQDTNMVSDVYPIPANIVQAQIASVLGDIGVDAVKIGMLFNTSIIKEVAKCIREYKVFPVVLFSNIEYYFISRLFYVASIRTILFFD